MDKTKLGVVAALTSLAVPAVAPAQTFADLLQPIPDAAARLQHADLQGPAPQLIQAQYHHHHHVVVVQHHHHHVYRHYRRVIRRVVRTQDHHHHHN